MSQTFLLNLATETLAHDAKQLGVTVDDLKHICVQVSAKIVPQPVLHLQLSYHIDLSTLSLATQFNWPTWQAANVGFSDYLWEETCLECFITGDLVMDKASYPTTESYIEINASPDGRYALYQFESYRNPATLPPTPLYQTDGYTRESIDWNDSDLQLEAIYAPSLPDKPLADSSVSSYKREFGVPLTQLPNEQYAVYNTRLEYIHPCVILKFGEVSLFFASSHASPPDFHNRRYWSKFTD